MASGYTYKIPDGQSFRDFILDCSKAFGALIHMRDMPSDTPIPTEIMPNSYHLNRRDEAFKALTALTEASVEELERLVLAEYTEAVIHREEQLKQSNDAEAAYKSMLDKVKDWNPPTRGHQALKDFMVNQISSSMGYDYSSPVPVLRTTTEFFNSERQRLTDALLYHTKKYDEESERCKGRNEWLQELFKSIPEE